MNQEYYDYIRQIHQRQYEFSVIQMELKRAFQANPTLRKRSLLYLSDVLINLGQKIRPAEFQAQSQGKQAQEGKLEIKARGC